MSDAVPAQPATVTSHAPQHPTRSPSQRSSRRHGWTPRTHREGHAGVHRIAPALGATIAGLITTLRTTTSTTVAGTPTDTGAGAPDSQPLPADQAQDLAYAINTAINAETRARTCRTQRGELTAWTGAITLPDDLTTDPGTTETTTTGAAAGAGVGVGVGVDAFILRRDWIGAYQHQLADDITADATALAPTIAALNHTQRSTRCWARPATHDATRGTWTGPADWTHHATDACRTLCRTPGSQMAQAQLTALITTLAAAADAHGHGITASYRTLADRARTAHGCTLAESTAIRRLKSITTRLRDTGLLTIVARGGHLNATERLAARTWHGHRQTRVANTIDLTLPAHLRPTSAPPADTPAWAHGLTERLAARNNHTHSPTDTHTGQPAEQTTATTPDHRTATSGQEKKSPYSYTPGLLSSPGSHRVAHARGRAREHHPTRIERTDQPHRAARGGRGPASSGAMNTPTVPGQPATQPASTKAPRKAPSLRAWRIADDLTRVVDGCGAANGPYARLVGPHPQQASLTHLARLIDTHTPAWAGTRHVMQALAHQATSPTTGHIALGLPRHRNRLPHNPTAWLTTLFTHLDFTNPHQFPTWTRTADAYGVTWNGTRHQWTPNG